MTAGDSCTGDVVIARPEWSATVARAAKSSVLSCGIKVIPVGFIHEDGEHVYYRAISSESK